jgi:hypothetical protein
LKLDPANQKTVLDLQQEARNLKLSSQYQASSSKSAVKNPRHDGEESDEEGSSPPEDVDISDGDEVDVVPVSSSVKDHPSRPIPMQSSGSITELRERLHSRMAALRRGRGGNGLRDDGEPDSKDALLEERRLKRAGLRENRRQNLKEKKKEEEARRSKGKDKAVSHGKSAKVSYRFLTDLQPSLNVWRHRSISLFPIPAHHALNFLTPSHPFRSPN